MNISRKAIFLAGILLFCLPGLLRAQVRQTREEYIDRYKHIAVEQMERYGIPASITMAQGILESDCGNSLLSLRSNNHFGIKCKSNWRGGKVYHDDDAKGECFRAYPSVEASYFDHAEFLDSQPRYDSLFAYASDDYRSWARGLKAAGYATAPDYAQRLVRIIEESQLYLLDRPDGERLYAQRYGLSRDPEEWFSSQSSLERPAETSAVDPDNYRVTINAHEGYNVYATNGVHYVLAKADDTFENIGRKFRISPRNLRRFNDLKDKKAQPLPGETVYIERKKKRWEGNAQHHICRDGETAYSIGQSYGIRTRRSSLPSNSSSISEAISSRVSFSRLNAQKVLSKTFCLRVDLRTIVSRIRRRRGIVSIFRLERMCVYLMRICRFFSSFSPRLRRLSFSTERVRMP